MPPQPELLESVEHTGLTENASDVGAIANDQSERMQKLRSMQELVESTQLDSSLGTTEELNDDELEAEVDPEALEIVPDSWEEEQLQLLSEAPVEEIEMADETHHVEIRLVDNKLTLGLASEWKSAENIRSTLMKLAKDNTNPIYGREVDIQNIFDPVKKAQKNLDDAQIDYDNAADKMRDLKSKFEKKKKDKNLSFQEKQKKNQKIKHTIKKKDDPSDIQKQLLVKAKLKWMNERTNLTNVEQTGISICKNAISEAWEEFGDVLPANLVPAGAVFRERQSNADELNYTYFSGDDPSNAIPLIWYKDKSDYPDLELPVSANKKSAKFGESFTLNSLTYGVDSNYDATQKGFKMRKVAHDSDRGEQQKLNQELNSQGVKIKGKSNPLSNIGGYDGDHVQDLGFSGKDIIDNYWPLPADVNRRAFHGYNSSYVLHYIDTKDKNKVKAKAVGGLIGKYFVVKGFDDRAVPLESGKKFAGTVKTS